MEKTYEVKGGSLTVKAQSAHSDTKYNYETRQEVTTETPLLRVEGEISYRGRKYTIDRVIHWAMRYARATDWKSGPQEKGMGWVGHAPSYDRGFRKENNEQVSWDTPTYDSLTEFCEQAANEFIQDFPAWARESLAIHYRYLINRAEGQASELTKKLNEAVAEVARLKSMYAGKI